MYILYGKCLALTRFLNFFFAFCILHTMNALHANVTTIIQTTKKTTTKINNNSYNSIQKKKKKTTLKHLLRCNEKRT